MLKDFLSLYRLKAIPKLHKQTRDARVIPISFLEGLATEVEMPCMQQHPKGTKHPHRHIKGALVISSKL